MPAPDLAVIDAETSAKVAVRLKRNAEIAKRKREYLLVGHIRCTCGRGMIGKNKRKGYRYYMCCGRSLARHLRDCDERYINANMIEGMAWDWLTRSTC